MEPQPGDPPSPAGDPPTAAGHPPTGGSGGSGSFAFFASPEQPLTPTGSNGRGAFAFLASPERPLTPMGSTASGGFGVLAPQPSLSPSPRGFSGTGDPPTAAGHPPTAPSPGLGAPPGAMAAPPGGLDASRWPCTAGSGGHVQPAVASIWFNSKPLQLFVLISSIKQECGHLYRFSVPKTLRKGFDSLFLLVLVPFLSRLWSM